MAVSFPRLKLTSAIRNFKSEISNLKFEISDSRLSSAYSQSAPFALPCHHARSRRKQARPRCAYQGGGFAAGVAGEVQSPCPYHIPWRGLGVLSDALPGCAADARSGARGISAGGFGCESARHDGEGDREA